MTTLRRLMVADYLLRGLLAILAVVGVTSDVRAQSPIRVGYYDMNIGAGVPTEQEPPIVAAGFTPVQLNNVTAADLAGLHVLLVQNPITTGYGAEYLASVNAIQNAVNSGLILIIHDRFVGPGPSMTRLILPLPAGAPFPLFSRVNSINNGVSDPNSLVANGPAGVITETNLDNGNFSTMGSVSLSTLIVAGKKGLLHNGTTPNQAITFSYPVGTGFVIYSSIPLDAYLKGMNPAAFTTIYAPNVLAYAGCGLKALPATVFATNATGNYGGTTTLSATVMCGVIPVSNATVNFTLNGTAVGSAVTDASGTATLANASLGSSAASALAVGSYPAGVSAAFAGTTQYGASSATAGLTVHKAPATISFNGGTFVYDAAPHAATGTVKGVFGESLGVPTFAYTDEHDVTSDVAPVTAGTYRITASVAESANYLGTSDGSSAVIKIKPASLAVTAEDKSKVYGAAMPTLTATYLGFVGGENTSVLGGSLQLTSDATVASRVDEYRIRPSGLTSNNYDIKFIDGILAVTPAPLTVRAANADKIYGAELPVFAVTYEGFVLGETVASLQGSLHFDTDATEASAVGVYDVTPAGLHSRNYTIRFEAGHLTVGPAALTVRADDKNKVYGAALPALSASYDGFVLHDGPGALGGALLLSTDATAASHVGSYAITPSGLTSTNYTLTFVPGVLAVTRAALTVRADDTTKLYGAPLPRFTAGFDGFVLGETPASLSGALTFTTNATMASAVGRYRVTPSGLMSVDYSITFLDGALMVRPAPLKIRADNKERLERLPNPLLTVTYEGFVLGEDERDLDTPPQISTAAQLSSPDGQYPIDVRGAQDPNYAIEHVDGTLTVSPEGRMHGNGVVETGDAKHRFDFVVSDTIRLGEKGSVKLEVERKKGSDDKFVSLLVSDVMFEDAAALNPGGKAEADSVTIVGLGRWNGLPATFEASATDKGEKGAAADTFTIRIFVAGKLVNSTSGVLKSGNIQSNRLPRR